MTKPIENQRSLQAIWHCNKFPGVFLSHLFYVSLFSNYTVCHHSLPLWPKVKSSIIKRISSKFWTDIHAPLRMIPIYFDETPNTFLFLFLPCILSKHLFDLSAQNSVHGPRRWILMALVILQDPFSLSMRLTFVDLIAMKCVGPLRMNHNSHPHQVRFVHCFGFMTNYWWNKQFSQPTDALLCGNYSLAKSNTELEYSLKAWL